MKKVLLLIALLFCTQFVYSQSSNAGVTVYCFQTIKGVTSFLVTMTFPTSSHALPTVTSLTPWPGGGSSPVIYGTLPSTPVLTSTGTYLYTIEYDLPTGVTLDPSQCYSVYFDFALTRAFSLCACPVPAGGCYSYDPISGDNFTIVMTHAMYLSYSGTFYLWLWDPSGTMLPPITPTAPLTPSYHTFSGGYDYLTFPCYVPGGTACVTAFLSKDSPDGHVTSTTSIPEETFKICPCCEAGTNNFSYAFDANSPYAITFTPTTLSSSTPVNWKFGDGTYGTGIPVTHTYSGSGYITPTVCMLNTTGGSGSTCGTCEQICIAPPGNTLPAPCDNFHIVVNSDNSVDVSDIPSSTSGGTYSWNFGDGTTATGGTATHKYAAVGSYTITLTATYHGVPCVSHVTICVNTPTNTTAVANLTVINKVLTLNNVYPNPASTNLNINLSAPVQETLNITVFDVTGRIVYSNKRSVYAGTQNIIIPVSALPNGMYSIEVTDLSNTCMGKFVKY